jgi:hypothetical protein
MSRHSLAEVARSSRSHILGNSQRNAANKLSGASDKVTADRTFEKVSELFHFVPLADIADDPAEQIRDLARFGLFLKACNGIPRDRGGCTSY